MTPTPPELTGNPIARWLLASEGGVPRIIVLLAAPLGVLLFGTCALVFVVAPILANSVHNDTGYSAVCKEPGPGPLQGPFEVKPGQTKQIGLRNCRVFDVNGRYLGCLDTDSGLFASKTFRVSEYDPSVTYADCTDLPPLYKPRAFIDSMGTNALARR